LNLSPPTPQWHRSPRSAWLRVRRGEREVLQFNGPVLELMTDSRTRLDRRIAGLGPDILAPELDTPRILRRLREDDPTRGFGDALLDQRTVAGIGNLWKSEGCWDAKVDPWRRTSDVPDEQVLAVLRMTRERMQDSARGGMQMRERHVYRRDGRPCLRCGTRIVRRGQGDDNRTTYWCPGCQT
jgi:endonuclease-8